MASVNTYRVQYHWERNNVKVSAQQQDYCQAAGPGYDLIRAAIVTNGGKGHGNGVTFVIDAVQNVGIDASNVLS
jgi:hypothetical protein